MGTTEKHDETLTSQQFRELARGLEPLTTCFRAEVFSCIRSSPMTTRQWMLSACPHPGCSRLFRSAYQPMWWDKWWEPDASTRLAIEPIAEHPGIPGMTVKPLPLLLPRPRACAGSTHPRPVCGGWLEGHGVGDLIMLRRFDGVYGEPSYPRNYQLRLIRLKTFSIGDRVNSVDRLGCTNYTPSGVCMS